MNTTLCDLLGIEIPIVLAPNISPVGAPTGPRLAAAVSEAGGLGTMALWLAEIGRINVHEPHAGGPSPRGRGSPSLGLVLPLGDGSIPAWAGEPRSSSGVCTANGVHPRVGGGAKRWPRTARPMRGPSPRGRGSRGSFGTLPARYGSIPAWAGEPFSSLHSFAIRTGPSPRGRGSQPLR